jgi:hypothetical protein
VATGQTITFGSDLVSLFSTFQLLSANRKFVNASVNGVSLPLEPIPSFVTDSEPPIVISAEFAQFYAGRLFGRDLRLFEKSKCHRIRGNGIFFARDWVEYRSQLGMIVSVSEQRALFLSLDRLGNGLTPEIVDLHELSLVATLAGDGVKDIDGKTYCLKVVETDCVPGDIFIGKSGFYIVIGMSDNRFYARDSKGTIDVFCPKEFRLVRRLYRLDNTQVQYGTSPLLNVSVCVTDMAGLGCFPGESVLYRGKPAAVCGVADDYVWVTNDQHQLFCVRNRDVGKVLSNMSRNLADYTFLLPGEDLAFSTANH